MLDSMRARKVARNTKEQTAIKLAFRSRGNLDLHRSSSPITLYFAQAVAMVIDLLQVSPLGRSQR